MQGLREEKQITVEVLIQAVETLKLANVGQPIARWIYMFRVKKMTAEDFAFAVRLTDTMNWNLVEEDFEFMAELEPEGCFVAFSGSERAGIATTISYGRVGWLGNVIVSEKYRSRGVGSLLVKHSIEYLANKHVETIGLYSYIDRVRFYRRLGFKPDSVFVVLKGSGVSTLASVSPKEVGEEDLTKIIDLDRLCFGASRRKLLKPILLNSENLCYASVEGEQVLGFIVAKVYGDMAEVGPLGCRRGRIDVAIDLLKTTLNKLEGVDISMCIPKEETMILNRLMKLGFREQFPVVMMFHGNPLSRGCIYAAESLERG